MESNHQYNSNQSVFFSYSSSKTTWFGNSIDTHILEKMVMYMFQGVVQKKCAYNQRPIRASIETNLINNNIWEKDSLSMSVLMSILFVFEMPTDLWCVCVWVVVFFPRKWCFLQNVQGVKKKSNIGTEIITYDHHNDELWHRLNDYKFSQMSHKFGHTTVFRWHFTYLLIHFFLYFFFIPNFILCFMRINVIHIKWLPAYLCVMIKIPKWEKMCIKEHDSPKNKMRLSGRYKFKYIIKITWNKTIVGNLAKSSMTFSSKCIQS